MSHEALDKIKNTAILPSTAIISASALTPLTRSSFSKQKLKALYMESSPSSDLESNDNVDGAQQQQQQQQQHAARAAKENVNGNHHRRGDDASMSPASSKEEEEEDDDDDDEEEEEEGGDNSEDESKNDGGSDCEEEGEGADVVKLAVTPSPNADRDVDVDVDAVPLAPATTKTNDGESPPPPSSTEELADVAARRSAWPMSGIAEPGLNDCLFGRGGGTNHHPGNKLYRKIVEDRKEVYLTSKRLDKPLVAMDIINEWRALDPPGRFLKQNDKTKLWEDVGDKKAREKTSQALREKTPTKQREGEERGGGGGGGGDDVTWGEGGGGEQRNARFQPGTASPLGRNVKRSTLARDHSLGGGEEIASANEISLEGFSWDDSDEQQPGDAAVVAQRQHGGGGDRRYLPPPQYPGGHREYYGGEQHPPHYSSYAKQHSLSNNPLSDATVSQPAHPVFGDHSSYYGHHYPPPPPPGPGYGPPPPPPGHHNASYPPPPPPPYTSPPNHQYHYSPHMPPPPPPPQSQPQPLKGATMSQPAPRDVFNDEGRYPSYDRPPPLPPPTYDNGGLPPHPPPPHYYGYSPQQGWPTPPDKPHHQPSPQFSYHSGGAFGRYDSADRSDSSRSIGNGGDGYYDNNAVSMDQYGQVVFRGAPGASNVARAGTRPAASKAILREDPASAGSSQDYSKLAELIRDSSDSTTATPIDRSTSWFETGKIGGGEDNIRRTMSMPQQDSGKSIAASHEETVTQECDSEPAAANKAYKPRLIDKLSGGGMAFPTAPLDSILRNPNPDYHRPDPVKRDTSNKPLERSMKRVVLSRDQSEVARRLKEEQWSGFNGGAGVSSKLTKAQMLDRQMSVEMNMLGLEDKALGRVTTEGFLSSFLDSSSDLATPSPIFETSSSMDESSPRPMLRKDRVTTIDEIALDIANGKPPEEWEDTLDLVGLTENEIAEKWLKGET